MKRYLFCVCAIALACAAMETPARAQASALGSSFFVYAAAARGSATAYDSKNHVYLVVSAYGAVTGRFVSADGALIPNCASGAYFVLGGAAFGHFPRVAYSPDANGGLGGFIVTWHESDSPGGGNAVHARSVSLSSCLGPDRIVSNADSSWWEAGAAISYSSVSQRFLVAWRAIASGGTPDDIDARLLDQSGQPIGAVIKVTATAAFEDDPSIAYNPSTDQFLVAFRGADTSAFIAARTVAASSGAVGPQYELIRTAGTYITDTTFIASGNRYLVAWYQSPGGSTARFVNSAGVPEGPIIPLSVRFMANDALSLAYNSVSDTSFMVSHDQFSYEDGGMEISAAGVPGPGFGATSIGGKGNFYPRIAASSIDKKWMIVTSNVFTAIYGQFVVTASGGGSAPPPPPPPPPSVAPLTITSLGANVSLPNTQGTAITWTATTSGGSNVQYKFWRYTATEGWQVGQDYSSVNSFTWTPPAGTNNVQVWVRSAGSSAPYEAYATAGYFDIRPGARVTAFFASRSFPLPVHVPVTFTATASSGSGPVQYQFWRYSASTGWILAQDYSGSNSYTWFPLEGLNAMQVWVRTAGSAAPYEDYSASTMFTVSAAAVITGLTANVPFPALPGTPITWTASATSGGGTIEYKFWGYSATTGRWAPMRDWGVGNQLTWTPGLSDLGQFAIQVWVRDIGASLAYEDWRGTGLFTITQSTSLTLNMNRSLSGLRSGDSVTFSAQATGGTGNWEYAFWGFNGSAWILLQPYTVNQNNFSWGVSAGTLAIQVWIRAPGSNAQWERWATTQTFVVTP